MNSRMPELRELVYAFLMKHGASTYVDLYNGIPGVKGAYTLPGFSSRLHDMGLVREARHYYMIEGQDLKPQNVHPPYVLPLLRLAAERGGISVDAVREASPEQKASSQLEYLKRHGLVARKNTAMPQPKPLYEITEKGRELQIAMQPHYQSPEA